MHNAAFDSAGDRREAFCANPLGYCAFQRIQAQCTPNSSLELDPNTAATIVLILYYWPGLIGHTSSRAMDPCILYPAINSRVPEQHQRQVF